MESLVTTGLVVVLAIIVWTSVFSKKNSSPFVAELSKNARIRIVGNTVQQTAEVKKYLDDSGLALTDFKAFEAELLADCNDYVKPTKAKK